MAARTVMASSAVKLSRAVKGGSGLKGRGFASVGIAPKVRLMPKDPEVISVQKQRYIDLLKDDTARLVIVQGPAGSSKTHYAIKEGLSRLMSGKTDRIVITKPLVTIDDTESIGTLPGDKMSKMGIYFQHVFEILKDQMSKASMDALISSGQIEFIPLGYIRGVTFRHSFVIGDEWQSTSPEITKAFLTRIGVDSKYVLTGDLSQNDRRAGVSGLSHFMTKLDMFPEVASVQKVTLTHEDIVRDPMVSTILDIYNGTTSDIWR